MNFIAVLLGMSFDIGGIGGLLSGFFSKSIFRAMSWSCVWGVINSLIFWQSVQHGNANIITLLPILLAFFWCFVGWLAWGRRRKK